MELFVNNTRVSNINKNDLLYQVHHFTLELRPLIHLPKKITFGTEIEFDIAKRINIKNNLDNNYLSEWKVVKDPTISIFDEGGEVDSPVLTDNEEIWLMLAKVCQIIKNNHGLANDKTSSHIHFGTQILGNNCNNYQTYLNLLKLWVIYEDIIFKFSYGEDKKARSGMELYSKSCTRAFINVLLENKNRNLLDLINYIIEVQKKVTKTTIIRYFALNFSNFKIGNNCYEQKNTIEIRCPNGTLNPIIIQNNINFFANLLLYCRSENFDTDFINYLFNKYLSTSYLYSKFKNHDELTDALTLADLIFDNYLDKLYFLKQYLKDSNISKVKSFKE